MKVTLTAEENLINNVLTDKKRIALILLGIIFLLYFALAPPFSPAVTPEGKEVRLSREGQRAIGLFLLAAIWWIAEVVPIGATSLAIGFLQPVLGIRKAGESFGNFGDPAIFFILGSLIFGIAFTKTGLNQRLAYKMLTLIGEKTSRIYLGVFVTVAGLTHITAHTAVAAMMFPVLITIVNLYGVRGPSKFGKGLFIGMAFAAGAGSMITYLGGARNIVAVQLLDKFLAQHPELPAQGIGFFDWAKFAAPLGWALVFSLWVLIYLWFKPEKDRIPGLREKSKELYANLGKITQKEIFVVLVLAISVVLWAKYGRTLHVATIAIGAAVVFFLAKIIDVNDLEKSVPWNIVLLFGGAMSLGYGLWDSGAAEWLAVKWLVLFKEAHWLAFLLAIAAFIIFMTNVIMNVAAIAIVLPIALIMGLYMNVNPALITIVATAGAAMPLMLLIGAAPNAIAYSSGQFRPYEFFLPGVPGTILVLILIAVMALFVWPMLGLPPFL